MIKTKRAYEAPSSDDGFRILIDRLWPRGVTKAKAKIDLWLKDVAPSDALRKRFGHDPAKWTEFEAAYGRELERKTPLLKEIKKLERKNKTLTLVFGAKDEKHNNAVVLSRRLKRNGR
jgi:uncharacterized protein YeaO (DUF488 family)